MLTVQEVLSFSDLFEPHIQNRQEALEQKQDFLLVNSVALFQTNYTLLSDVVLFLSCGLRKRKERTEKQKRETENQEHEQLCFLWHMQKCSQQWLVDRPWLRAACNSYQCLSCPCCTPS